MFEANCFDRLTQCLRRSDISPRLVHDEPRDTVTLNVFRQSGHRNTHAWSWCPGRLNFKKGQLSIALINHKIDFQTLPVPEIVQPPIFPPMSSVFENF